MKLRGDFWKYTFDELYYRAKYFQSPKSHHNTYMSCTTDMPKSHSIHTKWATLEKLYNLVSACIVEIILKDNSTTTKQGL